MDDAEKKLDWTGEIIIDLGQRENSVTLQPGPN
jgi:hypothetical protein